MSNLVQFLTTGLIGDNFNGATNTSSLLPEFNIMIKDPNTWKEYYRLVMGDDVDKYDNLRLLEVDPNGIYYQFTEAVKNNPNAYKKYLGDLYKATYKKGTTNATNTKWDTYGTYNEEDETYTVANDLISSFRTWYNKARTDGKFGYFHLTPPLEQKSEKKTVTIPPEEDPTPSGGSDPKEKPKLNDENPYDIIPLIEQPEERKDINPWLTPIIAGHANDWLTAGRVANELKKGITVNGKVAPYKHAVVTNDFFTRTQMEKRAKEAEWLASLPIFGDAKQQEEYRNKYLNYSSDIRDKALALKLEKFNKTTKEVAAIANENHVADIETTNDKYTKIAAARKYLANINAAEALKKGAILSLAITELANEIRQASYIDKLDEESRAKQKNINDLQSEIDLLQEEYQNVYKLNIWDDENFVSRFNALAQDDKYSTDSELIAAGNDQDRIKEFFESKRDLDPTIKAIYNDFDKQKSEALLVIVKEINNLKRKQNIKSSELVYVSNTPKFIDDTYQFLRGLRLKSGGNIGPAQIKANVDRFKTILRSQDKFDERVYKLQRDANKLTNERLKTAQTNLDKALGRLSKEDLELLKKLFS